MPQCGDQVSVVIQSTIQLPQLCSCCHTDGKITLVREGHRLGEFEGTELRSLNS